VWELEQGDNRRQLNVHYNVWWGGGGKQKKTKETKRRRVGFFWHLPGMEGASFPIGKGEEDVRGTVQKKKKTTSATQLIIGSHKYKKMLAEGEEGGAP